MQDAGQYDQARTRQVHLGYCGWQNHVFLILLGWALALSACQGKPSTFEESLAKGDNYFLTGEFGEAIAQYERATHLSPTSSEAHFRLGVAYDQQWLKSFETARQRFIEESSGRAIQGLKLQPGLLGHAPYAGYGEDTKAKERALAAFREALRLDPGNWRARYYVAMDYLNKKGYAEAIDEFRQIIEMNEQYANAYAGMGTAFRETGQFGPAIEAYKKALALDPATGHTRFDLGLTYIRIGDKAKAAEELKQLKQTKSMFAEWLELELAEKR